MLLIRYVWCRLYKAQYEHRLCQRKSTSYNSSGNSTWVFFWFFHSCYCAIVNSSSLLQILLKFKTHLQQVFSAHSFYESQGNWLEADIQGVGNLFTDPQVLSSDYCFGDSDLGLCGMALFFDTFRHNTVTSALGIPFFPLLDRTWASFRIWRRHFPSTRKWFFY